MFSSGSVIEFLSIVPTLLVIVGLVEQTGVLAFSRILRCLCLNKLEKVLARKNMDLARSIFRLAYTIICIILIEGCFLLLVEPQQNNPFYGIFNYLYFLLITITTVGYGDIYAVTTLGRMSIILCILVIMFFIP